MGGGGGRARERHRERERDRQKERQTVVSDAHAYEYGFRMLLNFVVSAKSTKYTKLNRVRKFVRLQYYVLCQRSSSDNVFLMLALVFFLFSSLFSLLKKKTLQKNDQQYKQLKSTEKENELREKFFLLLLSLFKNKTVT